MSWAGQGLAGLKAQYEKVTNVSGSISLCQIGEAWTVTSTCHMSHVSRPRPMSDVACRHPLYTMNQKQKLQTFLAGTFVKSSE